MNSLASTLAEPKGCEEKLLKQFWKLDILEKNPKAFTTKENLYEQHFMEKIKEDRQKTKIIKYTQMIGKSHRMAHQRFYALESKLHRDSDLQKYVEFMDQYEDLVILLD